MKATQILYNLGQSTWLDNITRDLLDSGTLKRYVKSWTELLTEIASKSIVPKKAAG